MNQKNHIEEISKYNAKISIYNLVYKKFKIKWWTYIIIPPLLPTIASFIFLFYEKDLWILLTFPLMIVFCGISANFLVTKIEVVIRTYYSYALIDNSKYNYSSFLEIQKRTLIDLLGDTLTKKNNLLFLIDRLPSQQRSYSYGITIQTIIITITIITGVFLPKFLDYAKDMQDFIAASKALIAVLVLMSLTVIIIERFAIKGFVEQYIKNKNRMVRTLTNIYLDKYTD